MEACLSSGPSLGTTPKKGTKVTQVLLRKPSAATGTVDTESAAAAGGDAAVEPDAIMQEVDNDDVNDENEDDREEAGRYPTIHFKGLRIKRFGRRGTLAEFQLSIASYKAYMVAMNWPQDKLYPRHYAAWYGHWMEDSMNHLIDNGDFFGYTDMPRTERFAQLTRQDHNWEAIEQRLREILQMDNCDAFTLFKAYGPMMTYLQLATGKGQDDFLVALRKIAKTATVMMMTGAQFKELLSYETGKGLLSDWNVEASESEALRDRVRDAIEKSILEQRIAENEVLADEAAAEAAYVSWETFITGLRKASSKLIVERLTVLAGVAR